MGREQRDGEKVNRKEVVFQYRSSPAAEKKEMLLLCIQSMKCLTQNRQSERGLDGLKLTEVSLFPLSY